MGFLRIATHPAIFSAPLTPAQATAAVASLLERPNVRTPAESADFWKLYLATADGQTRGNHVPDAHLAALIRQHGVSIIYSRDRDLRRYDGIEVRDPFAEPTKG
jgi:toxin-antitoxin system PIN domain toxin